MNKEEKIINNISYFISKFPIVGGYGFDYKQALRILLQGGNYDEVCKWYINQIKGSDNNDK